MQTRQEPAPRHERPQPAVHTRPYDAGRGAARAESTRQGVTVRVSVINERYDEEEKEAGYGHGV
jgi:hypothetical protein